MSVFEFYERFRDIDAWEDFTPGKCVERVTKKFVDPETGALVIKNFHVRHNGECKAASGHNFEANRTFDFSETANKKMSCHFVQNRETDNNISIDKGTTPSMCKTLYELYRNDND